VQSEQVRLIPLGIDRQGDDGLDAEALRQLGRHCKLVARAEAHRPAGSPRPSEHLGHFRIDGQLEPKSEGPGELRPRLLHDRPPCGRPRLTGVDQPGPIAPKDRQDGLQHRAHHLFQVIGALNGLVDPIRAFEETQMRLALRFGPLALGDVGYRTHEFNVIAGLMAYSAAKAALTNYSKALSRQVAPFGVRVNTVAPGFIETKGAQGLIEEMASSPALILVPHGRKS